MRPHLSIYQLPHLPVSERFVQKHLRQFAARVVVHPGADEWRFVVLDRDGAPLCAMTQTSELDPTFLLEVAANGAVLVTGPHGTAAVAAEVSYAPAPELPGSYRTVAGFGAFPVVVYDDESDLPCYPATVVSLVEASHAAMDPDGFWMPGAKAVAFVTSGGQEMVDCVPIEDADAELFLARRSCLTEAGGQLRVWDLCPSDPAWA